MSNREKQQHLQKSRIDHLTNVAPEKSNALNFESFQSVLSEYPRMSKYPTMAFSSVMDKSGTFNFEIGICFTCNFLKSSAELFYSWHHQSTIIAYNIQAFPRNSICLRNVLGLENSKVLFHIGSQFAGKHFVQKHPRNWAFNSSPRCNCWS